MQLNDKRAWLYSVKLYMAAVATLGISLLGGLARPYWAMATVYVVSFPPLLSESSSLPCPSACTAT